MKTRFLTLVALLISINLFAQNDRNLPKGFAIGEEAQMATYLQDIANRRSNVGITTPPTEPVRAMAEWEELQAIVITWTQYPNILREIVRHAKEEVEVIIVCSNAAVVKNTLNAANIDWTTNITFIEEPFNSIWVRDYGPNSCYLNDVDSLVFVDWIYNRPRPHDDVVPEHVATQLDIPIYETTATPTNLVHTGGNFMVDGLGMGFSSKLILDENDGIHTEADVNSIMKDFMGLHTFVKMENLPYDLIHHIDMHMKLLDEKTLLVGEYPEGVADGPQIEANIEYVLDVFTSSYGDPFNIIRIPMPPENGQYPNTGGDYRTYTNALFVNKTILVPIYEPQYDEPALAIWEEAMPGYNIVGINCNQIIPASGALHCITKEVGVANPLLIQHNALPLVYAGNEDYPVSATIKHRSGIANATVFYTTDLAAGYQSVSMTALSDDEWLAIIPQQSNGDTVYYYIHAEANSGRQQVRPLPAPASYFSFYIEYITPVYEVVEAKLTNIFPNPASAITCIPIQATKKINTATLEIRDVLGRLVETVFEGEIPIGESKYFINAATYEAGTYFVLLKTEEGQSVQKLVVN